MSKAWALVRFEKTGNIYCGCYNGTVDLMLPMLCTSEECYDKETDCYWAIKYCQDLPYCEKNKNEDIDDVEIYVDYGKGFYWKGKGNESMKRLAFNSLDPYNIEYYHGIPVTANETPIYGKPDWVTNFFNKL